jgi:hypothetical protein
MSDGFQRPVPAMRGWTATGDTITTAMCGYRGAGTVLLMLELPGAMATMTVTTMAGTTTTATGIATGIATETTVDKQSRTVVQF